MHRRRPPRTAILLLLPLVAPGAAAAQRPDSVADTLVVRHAEVRVTVTRLAAEGVPLARLPYPAHVVDLREGGAGAAATAADLVRQLPGVSLADQFGSPFQPDLRLRGFQVGPVVGYPQNVSVFVDGVRVNEPDASQVNFNLIPLQAVERVEVIRSPGGAFGRNTVAGAIHLVTRTGDGEPGGQLEVSAGEFGRWEAAGWAGGAAPAGLHWLASGRVHRSEGWRDLNQARLTQLFGKLGWRGDASDAWLSYTFVDDYIEAPGSLPVSWLRGDLPPELAGVSDPRRLQFTGFEGDSFDPVLHFANVHVRREIGSGPVASLNAFVRSNRFTQRNDNITEPNVRGETGILSAGAAAQLSWTSSSGMVLSAGAEYVRNRISIRIHEEPNPAFPEAGGMTEDVFTRDDNLGAFAHVGWPISEAVDLAASLRFDHIHIPITDRLDPENSGVNTFRQLTGSIGADWLPTPSMRFFASYGRGFRAPVILELTCADPLDPCPLPFELGADPPLEPVTTDTWQVGARWGSDRTGLELVAFHAEVYDDLFPVVAAPATRGYFTNLDRTRREGLELAGSARILPGLALRGSLALTRATFQSRAVLASALLPDEDAGEAPEEGTNDGGGVEVEPGDRFAMTPAVTARAGIDYEGGPWSVSLSGAHVGSQYYVGDEANRREFGMLDPFFLVDAELARSFGGFHVFLHAQNLLDAEHYTFGLISPNVRGPDERPQPFLSPGLPRRILVGVGYRF